MSADTAASVRRIGHEPFFVKIEVQPPVELAARLMDRAGMAETELLVKFDAGPIG